MVNDLVHGLGNPAVTESALHLDPEEVTLAAAGVTTILAPGPTRVVRDYMPRWPPRPQDIERAINDIEDALMHARGKLGNTGAVASEDRVLLEIASVAGLGKTAKTLPRQAVEALFERLAAVALGRPNAQERLPEDMHLAASIVILREVMHHLDVPSIGLRHELASVHFF